MLVGVGRLGRDVRYFGNLKTGDDFAQGEVNGADVGHVANLQQPMPTASSRNGVILSDGRSTTIRLPRVVIHFGRPNEKRKGLTLRLQEKKETLLVGEVEFKLN